MITPQTLKDRFAGSWTLRRDIFDVDSQWLGKFRGRAQFSPDGQGCLSYHEEGQLRFGGLAAMTATRDYIWTFPGGSQVAVLFDDARPFHRFDAALPRAKASHYCDPDDYAVTYDFSRWPEWRAEWRVEGPRKDYRMVSIYERDEQSLVLRCNICQTDTIQVDNKGDDE